MELRITKRQRKANQIRRPDENVNRDSSCSIRTGNDGHQQISTKRKSLRFFSKKDSKTKEQVAAPQVVTPPSSPPSTINVKTRAPSIPAVKDDPVEDAAVGIGRKWALFFHREKGEIDEDSDDSSQEEDVLSFAVPASDLSALDLDRLSSPVTVKEDNLENDCSTEARKDDSKTGVMPEEELATPEASKEPVSLNEQAVSTETKENSSTVEASEVAPIDEPYRKKLWRNWQLLKS